jgi:hypothetical protein
MQLRAALVLGCISAAAAAQTFPLPREPQFWDGDRLVTVEDSRFTLETRVGRKKTVFLAEGLSAPTKCDFTDGAYWACQPKERDGKGGWLLLNSPDGTHREAVAWVPALLPEGPVNGAFPLPGHQILLTSKRLFVKDGAASFLAVGGANAAGLVKLDRLIEVDLGDQALEGAAKPDFFKEFPRLFYVIGFLMGRVRAGNHLVFAHQSYGRFVVLDTRTLKTRLVRLFPKIEDKRLWDFEGLGFEHALLGMQPRQNGHVLIASRSEEAVLKARDLERKAQAQVLPVDHRDPARRQELLREAWQNQDRKDLVQNYRDVGAAQYPEVLWWDLDPETGTLTREPAPHGAPGELPRADLIRRFRFRFDVKEEVKAAP